MFVVCRLQELGRKAGVSVFMCFIDLQQAYVTVDRTLMWQVLIRIGVLPQMIAASRQSSMMGLELVCDLVTASVRIGSRWSKDYGKDVCYPRYCSISSSQPC